VSGRAEVTAASADVAAAKVLAGGASARWEKMSKFKIFFFKFSVADPDPQSGLQCLFCPLIRDGENRYPGTDPDPGSDNFF